MAIGFSAAFAILAVGYLSKSFIAVAICAALGAFLNTAGNTIFSASIMLALPDENRGAILGFFSASSMGGSALSAVLYGLLGDVFPLSAVFAIGSLLSIAPTLFLCFNKQTKSFILSH